MGIAIEMRITMMVMTTMSSTNVKPAARRSRDLPFGIRTPVWSFVRGFAVNVEDVLPAPTGGGRVVLIAEQTPFAFAGERIDRNPPQEFHLLSFGALCEFDAI